MNSLKIATLNIAGLSDPLKRASLKNFLIGAEIDVACLQEVSFNSCPLIENHFKFIVNMGPSKRGTAVLLRSIYDMVCLLKVSNFEQIDMILASTFSKLPEKVVKRKGNRWTRTVSKYGYYTK